METQKKLPMGFDWRAAKNKVNAPNNFRTNVIPQQTRIVDETLQSIIGYIDLQILQTQNNIDQIKERPDDFIKEQLINKFLKPYYMMHRIDNDSILYIINHLNSKPGHVFENGFVPIVKVENGVARIDPKYVAQTIARNML